MKPPSIRTLDGLFSNYIRDRDTRGGMGKCYTCGKILPREKLQCGHYIGRQHYATRWEPDNCRAQCVYCNCWNEGEKGIFRARLVQEVGENRVGSMEALRRTGRKPRGYEAEAIAAGIKALRGRL